MWTDKGNLVGSFRQYQPILSKYGISDDNILKLQNAWNEPHRVYHNQEHLTEILSLIEKWKSSKYKDGFIDELSLFDYEILVLKAFYHDAVYETRPNTIDTRDARSNEEKSVEMFKEHYPDWNKPEGSKVFKLVSDGIMDTQDHTKTPSSELSAEFLKFDLHGMTYGTLSRMISDENKIMREYGFVDFNTYKNERGTKFLEKFAPHIKKLNPDSKVEEYLDWYKNRTPKIAIFAGSFYPFHKGHLDILKRAERIFDKVIVLLCVNPGKNNNSEHVKGYIINELRLKLPNNQVEFFDGMLHNYIKKLNYPVSIVKGLRNASDFDSEKLQLRYMEDMCPDINIVYIVSDRKYEHVSSSGIKQIQSMGAIDEAKEYLI